MGKHALVKEERGRDVLTSVETLHLEGGVGGFESLEHSHDKSAFSDTLSNQ